MSNQPYHACDTTTIATDLKTDLSSGLTAAEARRRLSQYGPNILKKERQKSILKILLEQFINPIVWLLIVAGIFAFVFKEIPEGIAIMIVIAINTLIGFFMELQAMRSMRELQKMGRAQATVIRDGNSIQVDSAELVPGDLISLEPGFLVTADARIAAEHNLSVKESALTGESMPVSKSNEVLAEDTALADLSNFVFKGTVITRGSGTAIVTGTGSNTELGKISTLAHQARKESTPLDKRLNTLSRKLIWLTLGITVVIFLTGLARGGDLVIMIETAIALAVAAIPEGLPVIASITLARGMVKLARHNAIVKTLESVQTLGETNIIFTDKTGTLTENELSLDSVVFAPGRVDLSVEGDKQEFTSFERQNIELMMKIGALCNNSTVKTDASSPDLGDPLEIALLKGASRFLEGVDQYPQLFRRVDEVPFDEDIKMMATVNRDGDTYLTCIKGAAESVLDKCAKVLDNNAEEVALANKDEWLARSDQLCKDGLRVLGIAYRRNSKAPEHAQVMEDLVFLGLVGFIDPARPDVRESILTCREAGIRVIMVTGDHPETAANIAEKVGLIEDRHHAVKVCGHELTGEDGIDDALKERISNANIFARTIPSQKLDLVKFYQLNHSIVGMTGDGVNDAPALKKADIGIAMGLRGTEVAKEVADIVLKDDSFSSIVLAIRQGRIIFNNIRIFVVYLLSCNLGEILVVGTASLLGIPLPLLPLQILFLNMVTDVFPALALGMNEGEKGIMKEAPRRPGEPIISRKIWISILTYGLGMTIAVIGIEFVSLYILELPDVMVNNMAFYTLILVQLWNVFNLPDAKTSFWKNVITQNKFVWASILLSLVLVYIAWLIIPVREALSLTHLATINWAYIILFSLIPTIFIQVLKRLFKIIQ